ncbi:hypothetical protein, partial [Salmonella sp. s37812]|uniref:hypothetical protein n=1 Tax=Salmonella sp. s37812 TaxID=3159642 RepID=UPI0039800ABE
MEKKQPSVYLSTAPQHIKTLLKRSTKLRLGNGAEKRERKKDQKLVVKSSKIPFALYTFVTKLWTFRIKTHQREDAYIT